MPALPFKAARARGGMETEISGLDCLGRAAVGKEFVCPGTGAAGGFGGGSGFDLGGGFGGGAV